MPLCYRASQIRPLTDHVRTHSSAADKAGPIDVDELFRRLARPNESDKTADAVPGRSQSRDGSHDRSPTLSPDPDDGARYQTLCYHELLNIGGRPAMPLELVLPDAAGGKDVRADPEAWAPWVDDAGDAIDAGCEPPRVFSGQLNDWIRFRRRWQWDNRGTAAGEEGFPAYLAWKKRMHLGRGEVRRVADPYFEEIARGIWDDEPALREVPHGAGFEAYTQAVEKRLASHHFTHSFQLSRDPRKQDTWTTWVEYLNYVYWCQDIHKKAMKHAEPGYQKAWTNLRHVHWPDIVPGRSAGETLDEQLRAMQATFLAVRTFFRETEAYREEEAAYRRWERRAHWVLEQLNLIEAANSPASKASGKKRKRKGQDDEEPRQQQKRRQKRTRTRTSRSASQLEPNTPVQKGTNAVSTTEGAAATTPTSGAAIPQLRRSPRLRVKPAVKH